MNYQPESLSNRISKLEEQLRNYSLYTDNLKRSFKRDCNEMKIEISQKDFELNTLKQQSKEQIEKIEKQKREIEQLTQTLKLLTGPDLLVELNSK